MGLSMNAPWFGVHSQKSPSFLTNRPIPDINLSQSPFSLPSDKKVIPRNYIIFYLSFLSFSKYD